MEVLFQMFPQDCIRFLTMMTIWGFAWGSITLVPTFFILLHTSQTHPTIPIPLLHIPYSSTYDLVIRCMLLYRILTFFLQLPFRFTILRHLRAKPTHLPRDTLVAHLMDLSHSFAWRTNQYFAVSLMLWVVLGMLLTLTPSLSGESQLTVSFFWLLAINAIVVLTNFCVAMSWLRNLLQDIPVGGVVGGATSEEIELCTEEQRFYVHDWREEHPGEQVPMCGICLDDFGEGQGIRRLPCGHEYHSKCIDIWLGKKRSCPLCNRPINSVVT